MDGWMDREISLVLTIKVAKQNMTWIYAGLQKSPAVPFNSRVFPKSTKNQKSNRRSHTWLAALKATAAREIWLEPSSHEIRRSAFRCSELGGECACHVPQRAAGCIAGRSNRGDPEPLLNAHSLMKEWWLIICRRWAAADCSDGALSAAEQSRVKPSRQLRKERIRGNPSFPFIVGEASIFFFMPKTNKKKIRPHTHEQTQLRLIRSCFSHFILNEWNTTQLPAGLFSQFISTSFTYQGKHAYHQMAVSFFNEVTKTPIKGKRLTLSE